MFASGERKETNSVRIHGLGSAPACSRDRAEHVGVGLGRMPQVRSGVVRSCDEASRLSDLYGTQHCKGNMRRIAVMVALASIVGCAASAVPAAATGTFSCRASVVRVQTGAGNLEPIVPHSQ